MTFASAACVRVGRRAASGWGAYARIAALLAHFASGAAAQELGGSIAGRVVGADGAPLVARVSVTGSALQGERRTHTDAAGRFRLELLPVGGYALAAVALGHRATLRDVVVGLGQVSDVGELVLDVEALPIAGTGVVAARTPAARRSASSGGNLTRHEMRALPGDRDVLSLVALLPHVNVSPYGDRANVMGTTGPESNHHVDGLLLTEPPGNAVSASLPYNLVEEIQVLSGGYEAEYGGAGGGLVNAVTRSGGNEFHGQVFGFLADRVFTASSGGQAVSTRTRAVGSWDAGASVGFPLRRDRLWLFLAYNPTFERVDVSLPGFGTHRDQQRADRFAGKLSWRASDATSVTLSALGDPSTRDQVGGIAYEFVNSLGNVDPVLQRRRGGGGGGALRVTHVFRERAALDARLGLTRSRFLEEGRTERGRSELVLVDLANGRVEGGAGHRAERQAGRSSASATLAWQRHAHLFKSGFAYEDAYFEEDLWRDQIFRLGPIHQQVLITPRRSANHTRVPAVFAQDAWAVRDDLTLNLGLRWAREWWMSSGGHVGQRTTHAWQPRLGVAWRLGGPIRTRVLGSAGRFHQQTRLNVPGWFQQDGPGDVVIRNFDHDPRVDPSGADTVFSQNFGRQPEVRGLEPALFDEAQLGAERECGAVSLGIRAVHREQRSGIVAVISPLTGRAVYGNPGEGELAAFPRIERRYRALEVSAGSRAWDRTTLNASYVWSASRGNYEGYWDQSAGENDQFGGASFMQEHTDAAFTLGPLPSDRRHQFKLHVARELGAGMRAGAAFLWASGTPWSTLGPTNYPPPFYRFLAPRGSNGRTPAVYDLNVRLAWAPPRSGNGPRPRLMADVYHVGNPRRPVFVDQVLERAILGVGTQPNTHYGQPKAYQPPVAYRFGLEVDW